MSPPGGHRGNDAVLFCKAEAEPGVITRIAKQHYQLLAKNVRPAQHAMHKRKADAAPLVIGVHAQWPKRQDRNRAYVAAGADHVPNNSAVGTNRYERKGRQPRGAATQVIDKHDLGRHPVRLFSASEGGGGDCPDCFYIGWYLASNYHGYCAPSWHLSAQSLQEHRAGQPVPTSKETGSGYMARYADSLDDFWRGILEGAQRPSTVSANTRPALHRLQSAAQTGALLAQELGGPPGGRDYRAFQIVFQIIDDFRWVDSDLQSQLVSEAPQLTGDARSALPGQD